MQERQMLKFSNLFTKNFFELKKEQDLKVKVDFPLPKSAAELGVRILVERCSRAFFLGIFFS